MMTTYTSKMTPEFYASHVDKVMHGSKDGLPDPVHTTPTRHYFAEQLAFLGVPESAVEIGTDPGDRDGDLVAMIPVTELEEILALAVKAHQMDPMGFVMDQDASLVVNAVRFLEEVAANPDDEDIDEHAAQPLWDFDDAYGTCIGNMFSEGFSGANGLMDLARTIVALTGMKQEEA